jgi:hypothetical protein
MNEDLFFVTNATDDQIKVTPRTLTPAIMLPPTLSPARVLAAVSPQVAFIDGIMKQQMVEGLAAQSGMNMHWAKKCLDESNWDIQQAIYTFSEPSKTGTIPAEAFIK